jgi:hypothetical protein
MSDLKREKTKKMRRTGAQKEKKGQKERGRGKDEEK